MHIEMDFKGRFMKMRSSLPSFCFGIGFLRELLLVASTLAMVLAGLLAGAKSANAQTADPAPPLRRYVDANGINLLDGQINFDISIAVGIPGQGGLARHMVTSWNGPGFWPRDNFSGTINSSGSTYTVSLGSRSFSYSLSGTTFTSLQGDGSTLTKTNATTYTLVLRDGTTVVFSTTVASAYGVMAAVARMTSMTFPSGEVDTFTYSAQQFRVFPSGTIVTWYRPEAVTNNFGYEIKYLYRTTGTVTLTDANLSQVIAINNAVDYCPLTATSCPGLTVNWPSLTFQTGNIVVDNLNRQHTYPVNSTGGAGTTQWIKPSGETISYTIDASRRVTAVSNGTGNWTYAYFDSGSTRTTTVTDPLGHKRLVDSNISSLLVVSDTDGLSHKTTFSYDSFGRLTRIVRPEGVPFQVVRPGTDSTTFTYDGRGNITQTVVMGQDGVSTITTSAGYDPTCTIAVKCNRPNWTQDARGARTDYTYNTSTGQVLTVVRPAGATPTRPQTTYAYTSLYAWYKNSAGTIVQAATPNSMLTKISQCTNALSCIDTASAVQSMMTYGVSGVANNLLLTKKTNGSGDGILAAVTQYTYDPIGNPFTQTDPLGNVTRFRYDAAGQLTGLVGPDPDAGGSLRNRALRLTYQCDATVKSGCAGLVTLAEQGSVAGQADSQWSGFTSLSQLATTYDGLERKTLEKQTNGATYIRVSQYSYDTANRLTCAAQRMNPAVIGSLPASACTLGTTGSAGPDRITAYTYDNDDKVSKITEGSGTTVSTDIAAYTYGDDEELATQVDGKGNKTTVIRDTFNRVYQVQFPTPGNGAVSSTTDYEQYTYDANGNVTQNRRRDGSLVNTGYDALNQPTSAFGGASFTYDNLGRMLTASIAGQTLILTYNGLNQQVSEQGPLGTITRQFDLNGHRKQLKYPDGYYVNYGFDAAGDMTSITDSSSNVLMSLLYDDLGRISSITRAGGQGPAEARGYGADLRLSSLAYTFGDTTKNVTFGYTYNLAGQPMTATVTAATAGYKNISARSVSPIQSDGQNKYTVVGANSLTYDGQANTTNTGMAGFTYDDINRMVTSGANTLTYDALSRLYQVAATRLQYDGQQIVAEYNAAGTLTNRYIPGISLDQPLISFTGTGTTVASAQWFLPNGFGSIVALGTTGASSSASVTSYDEFGVTPSTPSWRFQYKGMPYFAEIGLYHARARVYSQYLGRFMQPDPSGYVDGLNLYSFAHNSPINGSDPTGLFGGACGTGRTGCQDPNQLDEITVTGTRTSTDLPGITVTSSPLPSGVSELDTITVVATRSVGGDAATLKSDQPKQTCPNSGLANFLYALNSAGKNTVTAGKLTTAGAAGLAIVASPFLLTPAAPEAAAAEGFAGIGATVGVATTLTGYVIQDIAGIGLAALGDSGPLLNTSFSVLNSIGLSVTGNSPPNITPINPFSSSVTDLGQNANSCGAH